ncbi:hypothetical protein M9H77_06489 [Catharanthus roseus]|uniref:Uncharacterized protein n=1 Tax=Catharanthus roseus TaxID=4058 RepID=A0ACC0BSG6_CATRO|nr:hypothetical protein M9H77_06489 [Catharanthus roseus]
MDGTVGTIFIRLIEELQHFIQSLWWHGENYRDIIATGNILEILNPWVSVGEVPTHVIIMRRCLEPQCLYKSVPEDVHLVVRWAPCLLRLDRVGGNTLPKIELSQNPIRYVRLHAVKICNEPVPRGNPTITNILSPVLYPPNLISCHHIQSQANIQQFILILITDRRKHLDVGLASFGRMSKQGYKHGKIQIYSRLKYKI